MFRIALQRYGFHNKEGSLIIQLASPNRHRPFTPVDHYGQIHLSDRVNQYSRIIKTFIQMKLQTVLPFRVEIKVLLGFL